MRNKRNENYKKSKENQRKIAKNKELESIKKLAYQNASRAIVEIGKYLEKYPSDSFGKCVYADILVSLHKEQIAEKIYKELIEEETPNMYTAMVQLASLYKKQKQNELAEKYFNKAIEESPYEEHLAIIELARIYIESGKYEEAESILNKIEIKKEARDLELAKLKLLQEKYSEAEILLSKIPRVPSENFNRNVVKEKGKLAAAMGDYEMAEFYFSQILDGPKNNTYNETVLEWIHLELQRNNNRKAKELCQNLLNRNITMRGEIYVILGQISEQEGKIEEAREYYKRVINGEEKSRQWKGYFYGGMLEKDQQNYEIALQLLEKSQVPATHKKMLITQKIITNIKLKRFTEADRLTEEMIESNLADENDKTYRAFRITLDRELGQKPSITSMMNYSETQNANYSLQLAKEHIKKQHMSEKETKGQITKGIEIEELLCYVADKITLENLSRVEIMDHYVIEYPGVGYTRDGETSDHLRVVTLPNTKQIITMFPEKKSIVESTKKETVRPVQKRLSQIDKFNARYGIKNN